MKNIKNISVGFWALVCILLMANSCKVDPELTDTYGSNVAWSSEANLELYLNSFYPLIGQSYYQNAVTDDSYADILKFNSPVANSNAFVFGSVQITPGSNPLGDWDWAYTWITNCNEFLDGVNKYGNNLPADVVKRAEAEVRWFRAYVYFELAKRYGASVVLLDKLPAEKYHKRSEPDECWDFIAKDLDFAAENLPVTVDESQRGKLTKGAAYGLKARAMLYAKRWQQAADAVDNLNQLNLYDLYPDYEKLFNIRRSDHVENKESILEFGYTSPDFGYSFDYFYCPPGDKGYAEISPTEDLVSQYQMADGSDFNWDDPAEAAHPYEGREKRFYASVLYNGAQWKGRTIETYVGGVDGYGLGGGTTCTGYYMRKFFDGSKKTQDAGFEPGDLTYYFMRYAEVLLIYAEAEAQLGHMAAALTALNRVRARAGFTTPVTASNLEEFLKLLRHERMIELAFEGHRYWDLRRWGLAGKVINNMHCSGVKITKNDDGSFNYEIVDCDNGNTRVYPEKYDRFPIPSSEIQRNPLCTQFPEWK
jgi:hypothetical protein